jgi:hypothetical protein
MGEFGKIKCLRWVASMPRFAELGRWAAMTRAAILIAVTVLPACSAEAASYRGISAASSCTDVRASESTLGGVELPDRSEEVRGQRLDIWTFRTRIYGVDATAEIACAGERVSLVAYQPSDPNESRIAEAAAVWTRELTKAFPGHAATAGEGGVSYYCGAEELSISLLNAQSPVLMVVPKPGVC